MNIEIWTTEQNEKYDKYMSAAFKALRYSAIPKVIKNWKYKDDTLILATGKDLYNKLRIDGSLNTLRGSVWPVEGKRNCHIIYTYSPLDKTEGDKPRNLFNSDMTKQKIWLYDCYKAVKIYQNGEVKRLEEKFIIKPSFVQVIDYLHARREEKSLLAGDIETIGRNLRTTPFLFGLAHTAEDGICIPLIGQHGDPYWKDGEKSEIIRELEETLSVCPHMWQNALFDIRVLRQCGWKIDPYTVLHDTMMLHHTIDSALPHDLGFITSIYGMTPYWKDTLKANPTKLIDLPLEESSTYNLRDCVVLHQILPPMLEELEDDPGTARTYKEEAMPAVVVDLEQMETGVYLSTTAVEAWRKNVNEKIKTHEKNLRKMWPIGKNFNLGSSDHLGWLLANQPLEKFKDIEGLKDYEESPKQACRCRECNKKYWSEKGTTPSVCTKCGNSTFTLLDEHKVNAKKKKINNQGKPNKTYEELLALKEISEIPRFYTGKFKIRSVGSGKYQMDEKARQKLRFEAQRIGYTEMCAWIEEYDKWAHAEKQRSTYTSFPVWEDGKMHYNIKAHGTETGRSASGDKGNPWVVNILNQPTKKEKLLGKCYVAPRGCSIVSMDYSNLEARVIAYVVQDPIFIAAVESGNLHDVNARSLFKINEEHPLWKKARAAAKIFQFGRIQYGGGNEIYEKIVLACPDLGLTKEEFDILTDRYFETYQVFGAWRGRTREEALSTRISRTAFGRVRHLYGHSEDIVKQAYNFPGQGTASGVMNRAQAEAVKARDKAGLGSKLQVQIYDDLRWIVPNDQIDDHIGIIKPIMEQKFNIYGVERSFPVDIEIGPSWGELEKYKGEEK